MDFVRGNLYHIYNRGNDGNPIFYQDRNYELFLHKTRQHLQPNCNIICYSLTPHCFHFLIHATEKTETIIKRGIIMTNPLSEGLRQMLSSYSQAVNKQEHKTGNLFQQNSKFKRLSLKHTDYSNVCFTYIHQYAFACGLVEKIELWPYSSFNEYFTGEEKGISNTEIGTTLLKLKKETFYRHAYRTLADTTIRKIL